MRENNDLWVGPCWVKYKTKEHTGIATYQIFVSNIIPEGNNSSCAEEKICDMETGSGNICESLFHTEAENNSPLRKSLFAHVPPSVNFVYRVNICRVKVHLSASEFNSFKASYLHCRAHLFLKDFFSK